MQDGDVEVTHSSGDLMQEWINYKPDTPLKEGIHEFINWYKEYNELTQNKLCKFLLIQKDKGRLNY